MCGIAGSLGFDQQAPNINDLKNAVSALSKRGPDGNGIFQHKKVMMGHTRLSIIDTSEAAAQPFTDMTGRYTIVFNGEFFNFSEHKKWLEDQGVTFQSQSDTEVLLQLYIKLGTDCLQKINGFFAFAIYDSHEGSLFVARDRMGVKPLLYYCDESKFVFASEMKAITELEIPLQLDLHSLEQYLHLNYIPAPNSIFTGIKKLEPGHYFLIEKGEIKKECFYKIEPIDAAKANAISYENAKAELFQRLEKSVQLRMISDVPLGCFLSGGIDSSVITALAARNTGYLATFSIGFKDEPFFDETQYAQLVSKMHQTNHTVFSLGNNDLLQHLEGVLNYIDEPFADSSALAVYILSKETKKQVTVALSGDGADELFAGYNKHYAAFKSGQNSFGNAALKNSGFLWKNLPKSRNSKFSNTIRKIEKYSQGLQLDNKERYWRWAGFTSGGEAKNMLSKKLQNELNEVESKQRKRQILNHIDSGLNSILQTDMELVLANDMLVKVDSMSMANSLEVRTPFLDYHVVDLAFSLPFEYKMDGTHQKKILKETFKELLPKELFNRPKQGFEVPLLRWFKTDLKSMIDDLLEEEYIADQNIFNPEMVKSLKKKLFSANPEDSVAKIWALIVFQWWWKNFKKTVQVSP